MQNLIRRNTPSIAQCFILETLEKEDGKSVYTIGERKGRIVLGGDCRISQAMAYYRYLREYCGVNLSHCGNERIPDIQEAPLPDREIKLVIPQEKRVFMNYATFGYSCVWWDWERWEREIDFMAMNGINMPLSFVGTEAVLFYTLREFKYSENGALRYLSGPAYWPWQLTGNIACFFPLADKAYVDARLELGKKIIERETQLGMTPIMQGFAGVVPGSINKVVRGSRIRMTPSWQNFPVNYIAEPLDPLFKKFGMAFLQKQRQLLGAYHYYACDPFREIEPPTKKKNYLWSFGRAIDSLYQEFDSASVWVMQSPYLREEIVKSIPRGRLLILDTDGKDYESTDGFWGHSFILGRTHDRGNRNSLHGSIDALAENAFLEVSEKYSGLCGTGLFPEGLEQNPLYYDLAFKMLTSDGKEDVDSWLRDYARRRYGSDEKCLYEAVKALHESCYSPDCDGPEIGSVICARPSTALVHTAPGDTLELPYDNRRLLDAAKLLLEAENASGDGYIYDVCDTVRQVVSNCCASLYSKVMNAFYAKDVNTFERCSNLFLKLMEELDALLLTVPDLCLSTKLSAASGSAESDKEKQNFEINLLCQITLWGPLNDPLRYDYSWKEWGGLIDTYYSKRWHSFFEQLAIYFSKKHYVSETKKQFNGRNQYAGSKLYKNYEKFEKNWIQTVKAPEHVEGDTVEIARGIIEKYEKTFAE